MRNIDIDQCVIIFGQRETRAMLRFDPASKLCTSSFFFLYLVTAGYQSEWINNADISSRRVSYDLIGFAPDIRAGDSIRIVEQLKCSWIFRLQRTAFTGSCSFISPLHRFPFILKRQWKVVHWWHIRRTSRPLNWRNFPSMKWIHEWWVHFSLRLCR